MDKLLICNHIAALEAMHYNGAYGFPRGDNIIT